MPHSSLVLANLKLTLMLRETTQADLAASLGIWPSRLSEVIRGKRRVEPSLRARIAALLLVDEGWLFASVCRIPAPPEENGGAVVECGAVRQA